MGAIKGVGASAVEAIIEERERGGAFQNLPDLCRRIDLQRVNRRVFEALIRSGSLDQIGTESRDALQRSSIGRCNWASKIRAP